MSNQKCLDWDTTAAAAVRLSLRIIRQFGKLQQAVVTDSNSSSRLSFLNTFNPMQHISCNFAIMYDNSQPNNQTEKV